MEENYWVRRRRYTRRGIIRGMGLAAGVVTLAPVIAACGSNSTNTSSKSPTCALAAALTALNEAVVAATAPLMRAASLDGLRSVLTDDKVVVTEAFGQLTSKLRERSEGSFGIAGPRGVGKTTLIKFLATGSGLPPPYSADGGEAGADFVEVGDSAGDVHGAAPMQLR